MPEDDSARTIPKYLTLRSHLAELARIFPWVETLTLAYAIPKDTQYSMELCLEEALVNVIRHGYGGDANQTIAVEFERRGEREFVFTIEDSAPHFRPFDPDLPLKEAEPVTLENLVPGGHGIRLMRVFSNSVEWEPLEHGNRLKIGFVVPEGS
ncbi:MAG TPA: ATP-binding protein [Terracidiphilus sp.]|jgi:anti-sigma regulatory factor (Ser/Thr protein kinase)|nr:ATP-binding protein [Terracidiphilus sp.]